MAIGNPDDGAGVGDDSGAKKQRVDEQGDGSEVVGADPISVDRISALPDDLRRRILTHLVLKEAIRTGALARGWRDLWRSRWDRGSIEVCLYSRNDPQRELGALEQEPPPRLRMDRFSLVVETSWLKSSELKRFIRYATDRRVEDLHVAMRKSGKNKLNFHLPLSSWTLVCLSLHRISISNMYYKGARPFRALEAIRLYSVSIKVASYSLPSNGVTLPSRNLHSLRELQLLMSDMEAVNLADLYVFLKSCRCPNLKRLFVQLSAFSNEPMEGPIDQVREEPPQDGFDNLVMVKVMNFSWRPTEVQLVSFLLRKASSLCKILIVSPNNTPLDLPGVQEADLLLLKEALANGKIVLSEFDDATIQPYHSEAFIKF